MDLRQRLLLSGAVVVLIAVAIALSAGPAPNLVRADDILDAPVFLPIAANAHPIARCPDAISEQKATDIALEHAYLIDFEPPPGEDQPVVLYSALMTAGEHDEKYGFGLTRDTPAMLPWECVWWFELDGRKESYDRFPRPTQAPTPNEPTPTPLVFVELDLVIDADDGWVGMQMLLGPPIPQSTVSPDPNQTTGPSPTPSVTPTPVW